MQYIDYEIFTNTMLVLSILIGFSLAIFTSWKTWRNHMKHHVFRPLLFGFSIFLFERAIANVYLISHLRTHFPYEYHNHVLLALLSLIGYLILLSTFLYSAKFLFEKMDDKELTYEEKKYTKWKLKEKENGRNKTNG